MKKTLLMAAVLVLAACGEKRSETPAADTSATAAPAMPADTNMMSHDTGMMNSDTTMARDSMHQ
jgi:hypothetical protein